MSRPILSLAEQLNGRSWRDQLGVDGMEKTASPSGPPHTENIRKARLTSQRGQSAKSATGASWQHQRESRHARGYGTAWEKLRKEVLSRDRRLCQPCLKDGRVSAAHAVDHITPKAKGGTDDLSNLQAICRSCHLDKTMTDNGRRRKLRIGQDGWPEEAR